MPSYPRQDRSSRTGSKLQRNPLGSHRKKLQQRTQRPINQLTREYSQACGKLWSKTDLTRAAALAEAVKREWHQASVKLKGNDAKLALLKAEARKKFRRLLAKEVPKYRKWQALHKAFQQAHRKLDNASASGVHGLPLDIAWGDLTVTPPPPGAVEWVAPFPLFDSQLLDDDEHIDTDSSFTGPGAGNLVNNVVFNHDEDTPTIIGLYGLIRPEWATSLVSVGHAFRIPRAGRLQVNANVRNYYNKAVLSLRDNFGFSYGKLGLKVGLFIDIVRDSGVLHLPTTLIESQLDSDGDDVSRTVTDVDNSMLFQIEGTTEEILPVGEQVKVMVGGEVTITSELDDMESQATATYYWQVRRIFAGVV
jgi:hypothetical protein